MLLPPRRGRGGDGDFPLALYPIPFPPLQAGANSLPHIPIVIKPVPIIASSQENVETYLGSQNCFYQVKMNET